MCRLINRKENVFEKTLLALVLLSYIQPFNDGNKRTARIICNAILISNQYCPISFRTIDAVEYKKAMLIFFNQWINQTKLLLNYDLNSKNGIWKDEHEKILIEWADKAQCYRWLHGRSFALYRVKAMWYTIPVIVISTLTGTANFAQDRVPAVATRSVTYASRILAPAFTVTWQAWK